ncbi:hypothetical protein ACSLO9_33900, partial [Escherichia coli]
QVHFSKAFIGIDGWQPETGFTGRDMMRTDVVNAVNGEFTLFKMHQIAGAYFRIGNHAIESLNGADGV